MPAILSLEHITKRFGYRCILNDISVSIEAGEFVTLIGNNGAGKSTLLRIISTLSKPNHGKIIFNGKTRSFQKTTSVYDLMRSLKLSTDKVAIELNKEIINKKTIKNLYLKNKDKIEIVHFIGGG